MNKYSLSLAITMATLCNAHAKDMINDTLLVSSTREARDISTLSENTTKVKRSTIERIRPNHPAEILNKVAGVHVNNLGGEGHMTAIRQPITTKGVYVFLEDGLPTRPSGFFNHNGLYEINVPQAESIEVTKGPGSALYGSDAIGGIINVTTRPSPDTFTTEAVLEAGSYDFYRQLISTGSPINNKLGFRLDLNNTQSGGYRDDSDYDRQSATLRLDGIVNDEIYTKTILSYSQINQSGSSSLTAKDYYENPKYNQFRDGIGRRDVQALRLSTEVNYEPDQNSLVSITPYYRRNQMDLMPSWMISYDANDRDYSFQSYGVMNKYRWQNDDQSLLGIVGLDLDYTPSEYNEHRLDTFDNKGTKVTAGNFRTRQSIDSHRRTGRNYDYDATQTSISPYLHGEVQALDNLRLNTGLRYDHIMVDYTDNMKNAAFDSRHRRPLSGRQSYDSFSPKLGAVLNVTEHDDIYANYRHSFRAPSVGDLYSSGSSLQTDKLNPVKADSYELGYRANYEGFFYDVTVYQMDITDDILTYINGTTRITGNAGETRHRGIELASGLEITPELGVDGSVAYTKFEYQDFAAIKNNKNTNYAGNEVAQAPKTMGQIELYYKPDWLPKATFATQVEHVGRYYVDETNTESYRGHRLVNLRTSYDITDAVSLEGRILNVGDRRHSVSTTKQVDTGATTGYTIGNPRTFYVGLKANF